MSQSLTNLPAHIVFSTKYRFPFFADDNTKREMNAYLGGILKNLASSPVIINGVSDHFHILCRQSKNTSMAALIGEVKRASSVWIKTKGGVFTKFHWQSGYGAFAVGKSEIIDTRAYIENQEEHHKVRSFQDEFRDYLRENEIEWDERYVWD